MVLYKIYENVHGASNIVQILIIYNISFSLNIYLYGSW